MKNKILSTGVCKPYSLEACEDAAKALGKNFEVDSWSTKGCYSYDSGEYVNNVYYSTGGTTLKKRKSLALPKYRPSGHDCKVYGIFYFSIFLSNTLNIFLYIILIYLCFINTTLIFNIGDVSDNDGSANLTTGKLMKNLNLKRRIV